MIFSNLRCPSFNSSYACIMQHSCLVFSWPKRILHDTDGICLSSENAEKETLLESEGQQSTLCSAHDSQNIQNNSIVTSGSYGDTQIYGEKENPKYSRSPSFCDNKNAFSSVVGFRQLCCLTSCTSKFFLRAY